MRELPEPYTSEMVEIGTDHGGESIYEDVPLYSVDQVLAIQKQAYEDGLRDAAKMVSTGWSTDAEKHLCSLLANDILEMLTASQKRDE